MIIRLRQTIVRWLALMVAAVTLGRVDVNASGRATTTDNAWKNQEGLSRPVQSSDEQDS